MENEYKWRRILSPMKLISRYAFCNIRRNNVPQKLRYLNHTYFLLSREHITKCESPILMKFGNERVWKFLPEHFRLSIGSTVLVNNKLRLFLWSRNIFIVNRTEETKVRHWLHSTFTLNIKSSTSISSSYIWCGKIFNFNQGSCISYCS